MDTTKFRTYVELRQRQKERTAEADEIKKQANELEKELLDEFGEAGIDSMRITMADGTKRTVYLQRELWASREDGVDAEAVCHVLEEIGLGDFVKESYNTQTLSSWMRDLEREERDLPVELHGYLKGVERFSVRDRKA